MRRPAVSKPARPAAVVAVSRRSPTSSDVGPSSTFPYTVGATSTPLVRAVGTGSRIEPTRERASLSNTISSPRRGVIVNPSPPSIRSTRSLSRPAAFTTHRLRTSPAEVDSRCSPSCARTPVTRVRSRSPAPAASASVAYASGVVHGQTMLSPGTSSAPRAPGPRCGSRRYSSSGPIRRTSVQEFCRAFRSIAGRSASWSAVQAISSAPVRSTGIPARPA
jgi:hypothetical protein